MILTPGQKPYIPGPVSRDRRKFKPALFSQLKLKKPASNSPKSLKILNLPFMSLTSEKLSS
jgi:hypothetical protein